MYEAPSAQRASAVPMAGLLRLVLEAGVRIASAFLFAGFAYAAYRYWQADPTRITLLGIVVAESLSVCLALLARIPRERDWHPLAMISALCATYYFLGIRLAPGVHVIPEAAGVALQLAGLAWQIYAKLSLRLSFGLLPAHRGIVTDGAYRVVRHPMYLGYLISHIGFFLVNFSGQNALVYCGLYVFQAVRIVREERLLSTDPEYQAYKERVRYHILPGVF